MVPGKKGILRQKGGKRDRKAQPTKGYYEKEVKKKTCPKEGEENR